MDDVLDSMIESIDKRDETGHIELSQGEKCLLFVVKALEDLQKLGLVSEGPWQIAISDEQVKEALGDFKPTPEEIEQVILWMKSEGYMA